MKKRSFCLAFLALASFLFVLVACSDDKGDDPPPSSPAKSSSSSAIAGGSSPSTGSSSSLAGNSSPSTGSSSSLAGNSSSSAGSSSSEEGGSSSSLTGSSSSEAGESSSAVVSSSSLGGSIATGSSSSENTWNPYTGATLTTTGTGVGTNTIVAAGTQVTEVCFDINTTIAFTPSKNVVTVSCRARTSPAKALNVVVGHGGKCYEFVYPSLNTLSPINIPIELDSPPGGSVVAQDVCVRFSQQITHSEDVLTCGIINSTVTPPNLGTGSFTATSVTALSKCPWMP